MFSGVLVGTVALGLPMVALIQGVGPLRLLARGITYLRAVGFATVLVAREVPGEWRRVWNPALARARREL